MGCDGGSIPTRGEMVKTKSKDESIDQNTVRHVLYVFCALSQEPFRPPIVSCLLGKLYNKEAILQYLLDKKSVYSNCKHIQSLKDVTTLNVTRNPAYKGIEKNSDFRHATSVLDSAPFICPITQLEMNGRYKFVYSRKCGCLISERALKQIPSEKCIVCGIPFDEADIIIVNPEGEELLLAQEKLVKIQRENLLRATERKKIKNGTNDKKLNGIVDVCSEKRKSDHVDESELKERKVGKNESILANAFSKSETFSKPTFKTPGRRNTRYIFVDGNTPDYLKAAILMQMSCCTETMCYEWTTVPDCNRSLDSYENEISLLSFVKVMHHWFEHPEDALAPLAKTQITQPFAEEQSECNTRKVGARTLIGNNKSTIEETVVFEYDRETAVMTFIPNPLSALPSYYPECSAYRISYNGSLQIQISTSNVTESSSYCLNLLRKRLLSWCLNTEKGYKKRSFHDCIIDKETFQLEYYRLKQKYKGWREHWPEKTDPTKFIFEDIAIAAYLICLWKTEKIVSTHKFVDLGCGNGFLVYLLTEEGYAGYGVDLASRKIWSMYPKNICLIERNLDPLNTTFSDVEYIIGNHADELIPWIPIMALKSEVYTKYFIIPCCFYQLNGEIFVLSDPTIGKYQTYLRYIEDLQKSLGFEFEKDQLRIPSTKNVAYVGRTRRDVPILDKSKTIENLLAACRFESFKVRLPDKIRCQKRVSYRHKQ